MTPIKLVFLIALKQEVPEFLVTTKGCASVSLKALLAGDFRVLEDTSLSVLSIVTGVGRDASIKAATWVKEYLKPYQVINLGCAGSQSKHIAMGDIVLASSVTSQESSPIACLDRLPVLGDLSASISLVSLGSVCHIGDEIDTDVVDMEAYWEAQIFLTSSIAFSSVKYITDTNDEITRRDITKQFPALRDCFNNFFQPIVARLSNCFNYSISVVIPTYNRASLVVRAVESVLQQSYPCDCIVIDDASTDDTLDQLSVFGDRIQIVLLSKNQGVSAARNQGVLLSKTPWIAFLDSDDVWKPDKLAKQVAYLKRHPLFDITQSDEDWICNEKLKQKKVYHLKQEGWFFHRCLERCLISPSAVLLTKRLFDDYNGFNPDLPACEDYDLWCRITRDYPVGFNKDVGMVKYAGHANQLSALPFLDQYRLKTLSFLYDQEKNMVYKLLIATLLMLKERIVSQGKLKRLATQNHVIL